MLVKKQCTPLMEEAREALGSVAADFCAKHIEMTSDQLAVVFLQVAAAAVFARGGERNANVDWALRNFVTALSEFHGVELEVCVENFPEPAGVMN